MSTAILIPARMEANRFPGKPLEYLRGRSLLQHAYRNATEATAADVVAVVTDSQAIVDHCREADLFCVFDPSVYRTGSDRCAGVLDNKAFEAHHVSTVVNLQCDEPEVTGEDMDALIATSIATGRVVTASCEMPPGEGGHSSPNAVKVVTQSGGIAAYFSRQPLQGADLHVGVYVYPLWAIRKFHAEAQPKIERAEGLEQLRMIYSGTHIVVLQIHGQRRSINCPEDIARW